jgi:hypothetical protein
MGVFIRRGWFLTDEAAQGTAEWRKEVGIKLGRLGQVKSIMALRKREQGECGNQEGRKNRIGSKPEAGFPAWFQLS